MTKREEKFIKTVWDYYKHHKRHRLPWRTTKNPYHILVSEMMLQQTQVDRVTPKYTEFLKKFPTVEKLAQAPLAEVLILWQGLGYNRRAKMLRECAKIVVAEHKGIFPKTESKLLKLPGVGPYTASAVIAFAYNKPVTMIETNIRSVYLHHFFRNKTEVSDTELVRYIVLTSDIKKPREWYYALMDYGSYIKKIHTNPSIKSKHYAKQSTFKGSDRQIRGAIVRTVSKTPVSRTSLHKMLSSFEDIRVDAQVAKLLKEQMIILKNKKYSLPH